MTNRVQDAPACALTVRSREGPRAGPCLQHQRRGGVLQRGVRGGADDVRLEELRAEGVAPRLRYHVEAGGDAFASHVPERSGNGRHAHVAGEVPQSICTCSMFSCAVPRPDLNREAMTKHVEATVAAVACIRDALNRDPMRRKLDMAHADEPGTTCEPVHTRSAAPCSSVAGLPSERTEGGLQTLRITWGRRPQPDEVGGRGRPLCGRQ